MKKHYMTPIIEIVEIEVEVGFAISGGTEKPFESEGSWGTAQNL